PAIDGSLCRALPVMGMPRPWCGRDEPGLGVFGIDCQAPAIVSVAPHVSGDPTVAAIAAPCGAAASRLIGAARYTWVPGKSMDILLCARTVVLPGFAAIDAAHQAAQLDANQKQAGVVRRGCDRAHMTCPRSRREAPIRIGGQFKQRLELSPGRSAIATDKEMTGLGAGIEGAI